MLPARVCPPVEPLLGPPRAVPVLSGVVAGVALAGAAGAHGLAGLAVASYLGVLLAVLPDPYLSGWRRGMLLPVAVAAGATLATISAARLVGGEQWAVLALLCLLTAAPTVWAAARQPADRPKTLPTAVGYLGAALLFALAAGLLTGSVAAVGLTGLYGTALAGALVLDAPSRRPTVVAGVLCAAWALALLLVSGRRPELAAHLAVQGLATCAWAWWTGRWPSALPRPDGRPPDATAWRVGAVQLVLAAWTAGRAIGIDVVEAYTLPLAAGLLLGAGRRLAQGPSWPAWAPGLLAAAVPSTLLAIVGPGTVRPVLVLAAAGLALAAGGWWGVRALLVVGAGSALTVALGLAVVELPLPALAALAVGLALLGFGASREANPVAGFGARLAEMR
jgi:hypothetical protein